MLEFETQDSIVGVVKSGLREVSIPFSNIEEISYKSGFLGGKVEIIGKSMKVMEDIPGAKHGTATLHIRRKDRKRAGQVLSRARLELSEYRLKELDG